MKAGAKAGHVYLVGAGPGDPSLLTMRAHELLRTASHIYPDGLISEEILSLAGEGAVITAVGKRCGRPRVTQTEINEMIIASARAGHSVVRMKSGDPLVFGRAGEEIEALREAKIPLEIVPGITTAFAAAAVLQVPLTDRTSASKLILATGALCRRTRPSLIRIHSRSGAALCRRMRRWCSTCLDLILRRLHRT